MVIDFLIQLYYQIKFIIYLKGKKIYFKIKRLNYLSKYVNIMSIKNRSAQEQIICRYSFSINVLEKTHCFEQLC